MAARKDTLFTDKEESLCQARLLTVTAAEAYRNSLYKTEGMTNSTIAKLASETFAKPKIKARMAVLLAKRVARADIDADYVLKRLVEIDELDILDIMSDDMSIKPLNEWPKVWRTTITSIDVLEEFMGKGEDRDLVGFIKKLKLPDKLKNLELLGKHVDVLAWKEQHTVEHTLVGDIVNDIVNGHGLPSK